MNEKYNLTLMSKFEIFTDMDKLVGDNMIMLQIYFICILAQSFTAYRFLITKLGGKGGV